MSIQSLVERETIPCSNVQFIKPSPASPPQRVPSQSKTATRGFRFSTLFRNSSAVHWTASHGIVVKRFNPLQDLVNYHSRLIGPNLHRGRVEALNADRSFICMMADVVRYSSTDMRIQMLCFRTAFYAVVFAAMALSVPYAWAQSGPAVSRISATSIPSDHLMQAADLASTLKANKNVPVILQVGSRMFFDEAHIPGSQYAGPGSQASGLQLLDRAVAGFPKDKQIVLYCGCCPWGRCPNVGPAFRHMQELGFTNVKVLYLPNNFGDDWVSKGYPTSRP